MTALVVSTLGMIMLLVALEMVFLNRNSKHIENNEEYSGKVFLAQKYRRKTQEGAAEASSARLVVMGLCYNLGDRLHRAKAVINRFRAPFKDSRVVLFENDSTDQTRELLKQWAEEDGGVHVLDCCAEGSCECKLKSAAGYAGGGRSLSRIERMSKYRNRCLDYAKEHYADFDYVLVMDMDINGAVTPNAMELALAARKDTPWDSVSCAGKMPMFGSFGAVGHLYDSLSFVPSPKKLRTFDEAVISAPKLTARWFQLNGKALLQGKHKLMRVGAYFGGMTLYRADLFFKSRYVPSTCEHIGLQKQMQEAAGRDGQFYILLPFVSHMGIQGPNYYKEK